MDNSLDQKLLAFISSQSSSKPLSPSKSNNLPKADIKSLESLCVTSLDTLLNNIGGSTTNNSILPLDSLDAIEVRLRGLYLIYADDPRKSFDILRKHQLYIVKLFNIKQIDYVYQNLNVLLAQINKVFKIEFTSKSTIFTGIEFTDFNNWNDDTSFFNVNRKDITQLIIAFHFLVLQWIAQYVSKNLKSILMQKNQFISLDEFCNIPQMFLNSSNFRKWQLLPSNENIGKYNTNNVKLISGFIKVFQSIKVSSSLSKYVGLTNCLKLKLYELTKDESLLKSIGFSSNLIPFINDANININDFIHKHVPIESEGSNELQTRLLKSPQLVTDSDFLRNLQNDSQLSVDKCQIIISSFNGFKDNLKTLSNQQLSILDLITIYLKDSLDESVVPILSQSFQIYSHFKLMKRMRNISNLLFNLGNKVHNEIYRNLAVDYECAIFGISPNNDNFKQLYNKLTRTQVTGSVLGNVLQCFETYISLTDNKDDHINGTIIQFICKTLSQTSNFASLNNIKNENLKYDIVNDIFQFMEKSNNTAEKTKVCNSIIESTSWCNQLIECKIYYQYYNVNGLEKYLDLEEKSCDNQLVTSGIQFQRLVTFGWNETLLVECLNNLKYGLNYNSSEFDLFELNIIKQVLLYIKYNGMIDELIDIIEILLAKSIKDEQFENFLKFEYCRALLSQTNNNPTNDVKFSQIFLDLKKRSQNWKSFDDIIQLSLLQLQYCIYAKNSIKAKDRFNGILQTLLKKPQFNISKSKNLPIVSKLQNFLILGKFQLLACHVNNHIIHNKIEAFNNIKTGIQLLYSIVKKLPTNINKTLWQELNWEITRLLFDSYKLAIDLSIDIGISRDIPLFLNEWVKLNNSIDNDVPIVNCINEFEIGRYGLLSNNEFQKYTRIAQGRLRYSLVKNNGAVQQYINRDRDDEICGHASSSRRLKSLVRTIFNSDNSLSELSKSVQLLPCIIGDSSTMCSKGLLDKLVQLKNEILTEVTNYEKSRSLSLNQQQQLINNLNQVVCLLSSLTSFKGDGLLSEVYYLQDYVRNLPFANERKLMDSSKQDESNNLLPRALNFNQVVEDPSNNTINNSMIDFNVDLQLYLPHNWILVTLDICQNTGDLLISKLTKGSPNPIFMRLPLSRFPSSLGFQQLMQNFEKIIDDSNLSTKRKTTSKILTVEDRKQWWRSRFTLDFQLQDILHHVESKWFGGFISGIFTNDNDVENESKNVFHKFKQDLMKILKDCLNVSDDKSNIERFLQFNEFIYYCFYSMEEYNYELVDDLIKFITINMNSHGRIVNFGTNVKINKLHELIKNLIDKVNKNKQNVTSNNNNNNNNNNNSSTSTSTLLSPISKRSITKSINNKINNNKNGQGQLYDDFLEIYNFQTDIKSNEDKSTNSQLDLFEMPDIDGDKSISRPKKISDDSITGAYKKKVTYNRSNKSKSKSNSNSNSNFKPRPKPRPKPKPVSKNISKINQTSNINPWNELLDNIEESTVYLPKISLIDDENESDENDQVQIGVNEAQEGGETITTTSIINLPILLNFDNEGEDDEEDDEEEEEEEENLQQQLIQSRSLSTSPSNSNSNSSKPNKTYAQDRSYLILDQSYIDVKQELGESISRKHDFDNNNNDNTEEEEEKEKEDINNNKLLSSSSSSGGGRVINVHDFKIKSEFKINPILQDIIDGLLSNSFNLQLSSLLEIISKKKKLSISTDMTDMTDMTEGIIDIIIQYVLPLIDSNNKLINWLSSKIIFDIWKSTTIKLKEVEVKVEEKEEKRISFRDTFVNSIQNRLNDIEKNLNLEEENIDELKIIINQIPKIYRSMINELLE